MYKNLLKSIAFAALAIVAGACAKEQVASGDGETVEMTFNVDVPETTITTKGLSDAAQVDELICQVFLKGAKKDENKHFVYTPVPELTQNVAVVGGKATVKFSLVKGQTYSFAFWAQTSGTGYYTTDDLRSVTMNTDLVKANDPKMDAFFAIRNEARVTASYSEKVSLKRALAQVNFGTKMYSGRSDELKAQKSYVTLTGVPNVFHPFMSGDSFACEGSETVKFNDNEVISDETLSVNDAEYSYLASVYVFALNPNNTITDASAVVTLSNGKTTTIKAPNVPVKRNFKTNILGDLLTVDAVWNVDVAPEFDGGDTYDSVVANLTKGATVTLTEDYNIGKSNYSGLVIPVGTESVLNLNGYTISNKNTSNSNKAALDVRGTLTINGDGTVYSTGSEMVRDESNSKCENAVVVEQGGHLIINGGIYNVGKDKDGKCNSTIYVDIDIYGRSGSVEINGGVFMNEEGSNGHAFVLNQNDKITKNCFSVKGGTFVGFNPADNNSDGAHTNYVAEGYRAVETTYNGKQAWKVEAIPPVTTQDGLNAAIADVAEGETATVYLGAGEFTTYDNTSLKGKNVTVSYVGVGADKTTFAVGTDNHTDSEANGDYSLDGVTKASFKNMTIKVDNDNYRGYIRVKELEFENCVFENRISYWGVGKVTFKNCTFNQTAEDYNLWTYSGKDFLFDGCVFNSPDKCINAYKSEPVEYTITIKDCTFNSSKENKSVVELKYNGGKKYSLKLEGTNNCTNFSVSEKTGSKLYNCNLIDKDHPESGYEQDSIVYIDGKKVWENGAKVE